MRVNTLRLGALMATLGFVSALTGQVVGAAGAVEVQEQLRDLFHPPNLNGSKAGGGGGGHTNNWAVLVCSSRYWFNYRVSLVGYVLGRIRIVMIRSYQT